MLVGSCDHLRALAACWMRACRSTDWDGQPMRLCQPPHAALLRSPSLEGCLAPCYDACGAFVSFLVTLPPHSSTMAAIARCPRVCFTPAAARPGRRSLRVQASTALPLPDSISKVGGGQAPPAHRERRRRRQRRHLPCPTPSVRPSPPARLPPDARLLPDKLIMLSAEQVMPKGDLVLAKVAEAEEKTSGGILLPGSAKVPGLLGLLLTPSPAACSSRLVDAYEREEAAGHAACSSGCATAACRPPLPPPAPPAWPAGAAHQR